MTKQTVSLVDVETQLDFDFDQGTAVFKRTQEIDDRFLDGIADHRIDTASDFTPTGDMYLAASIPTVVVEQWLAEGFNIFDPNNKLEDIMKRLQRYDMERLIATSKRLY